MTTITANRGQNTQRDVGFKRHLRFAQAVAGALFSIFLLLHLSNILLAPFGVDVFNQYQRSIRAFYQFPVIELLLVIGPLMTHIVCGVWLLVIDRRQLNEGKRATGHHASLREKMRRYAGLFLLLFIVGHVAAVRGPSFFYGVYPEFEGLSFSLWFFPAYFYPYYLLLAVAGFYHASDGIVKVAFRLGKIRAKRLHYSVTMVFAGAILISLMAFDGVFFAVPDPAESRFGELGATLTGLDMNQPLGMK